MIYKKSYVLILSLTFLALFLGVSLWFGVFSKTTIGFLVFLLLAGGLLYTVMEMRGLRMHPTPIHLSAKVKGQAVGTRSSIKQSDKGL